MVRVGHEKEGTRPHPSPHRVVKGQQRSTQMGRQKRAAEEEEELLGGGQLDARAAGNAGGAGGGGGAANAAGEERAEASCLVRAVGRRLKQSSLVNGKQK